MTTSWTDYPATNTTHIKAVHINEVRAAIDTDGGTPPGGWTDGSRVSNTTHIKAKHLTEIQGAIQGLWSGRGLGVMPPWTSGGQPGGQSVGTPATHILASDINDVRRWFNYFETWGDLRGVEWFDASLSDFPHVGWNVELVYGVSNSDGSYNSGAVNDALTHCTNARNYGLVNMVRVDYQPNQAAPARTDPHFSQWISNFNQAVQALIGVASIFIVGNEPNLEGCLSTGDYAYAYSQLHANKAPGLTYSVLLAGPAPWSTLCGQPGAQTDLDWFQTLTADSQLTAVDGFALHTYESVDYGCTNPTQPCTPNGPCVGGDCGFRRYRDYLLRIAAPWVGQPVYLTEFNTHGFGNTGPNTDVPQNNYQAGIIQNAYQEVNNYNTATNSSRSSNPRVLNLCWFVDDSRGNSTWVQYALSNTAQPKLAQARSDFIASSTATGITA